MIQSRYNHTVVYDEKRGRIYVFGGLSETQGIQMMLIENENEDDRPRCFLRSAEYYDVRSDSWIPIKQMKYHRE